MSRRYLVEIGREQVVTATITANSPEKAIELVLLGEGEPGDPWYEQATVKHIRELED